MSHERHELLNWGPDVGDRRQEGHVDGLARFMSLRTPGPGTTAVGCCVTSRTPHAPCLQRSPWGGAASSVTRQDPEDSVWPSRVWSGGEVFVQPPSRHANGPVTPLARPAPSLEGFLIWGRGCRWLVSRSTPACPEHRGVHDLRTLGHRMDGRAIAFRYGAAQRGNAVRLCFGVFCPSQGPCAFGKSPGQQSLAHHSP